MSDGNAKYANAMRVLRRAISYNLDARMFDRILFERLGNRIRARLMTTINPTAVSQNDVRLVLPAILAYALETRSKGA